MPVLPLVAAYDHVLLDLDGCVWVGDEPTPRADRAVEALREAGKGIAFVTNDAVPSGEEVVRKLWRLGLRASLEEVVTVGGAVQFLLNERYAGGSAFVLGSAALHRHVMDAGVRVVNGTTFATRADVVVMGGHEGFDYASLRSATQAVARGADIVATSRDRSFPMPDGPWPGTGALLAALETATGATAVAVGKPEPGLIVTALDRLGDGPALVVGDRLDADVEAARRAGVDAAVVLTGETSEEQAQEAWDDAERARARAGEEDGPPPPTLVAVAPSLADLVLS